MLESEVVKFTGRVSRETVAKLLLEADVMLHPALEEGFCNAVIEAQAMQIPVVCSNAGGLPENVEHNVTGFVVPMRDPDQLAEKLTILANDTGLREKMGKAGRQRAETHFELHSQVQEFVELYIELARRKMRDNMDG